MLPTGPATAQVPRILKQFCEMKEGRCRKDKGPVLGQEAGQQQMLVSDSLSLPCLLLEYFPQTPPDSTLSQSVPVRAWLKHGPQRKIGFCHCTTVPCITVTLSLFVYTSYLPYQSVNVGSYVCLIPQPFPQSAHTSSHTGTPNKCKLASGSGAHCP